VLALPFIFSAEKPASAQRVFGVSVAACLAKIASIKNEAQ
jgi:hypothetical protein